MLYRRFASLVVSSTLVALLAAPGCGGDDPGAPPDSAPPDSSGPDAQPLPPDAGAPDVLPVEICDDDEDNDGDGLADCADDECDGIGGCTVGGEVDCNDLFDNDGDNAADCADTECASALACIANCPAGTTAVLYVGTVPQPLNDNTTTIAEVTVVEDGTVTGAAIRLSATHPSA